MVVELAHERDGCDLTVRLFADGAQFSAVEVNVEPHPEPAPVADVGRPEEPVGLLLDELGLHAGRGGAPDTDDAVAVMIVDEHHEGDEPVGESTQNYVDLSRLRSSRKSDRDAASGFIYSLEP